MVVESTTTGKPSGPSAAKVFFDQRVIPVLIDTMGFAEAGLEHAASAARRAPARSIGLAVVAGMFMSLLAFSKPRR